MENKTTRTVQIDQDLVDRIFEYIQTEMPEISNDVQKYKTIIRAEFAGEKCYIANRPLSQRQEQAARVLALFNGRNTAEVARKLKISRTSVWRYLKQPGGIKPFQNSLK